MADEGMTFSLVPEAVLKARPRQEFTELGRTGLKHASGFVDEEFSRSLRGSRGAKIFKEMRDNDPIIGAVLMALTNLVRQAEWRIEPFDDSAKEQEKADLVDSSLHDMYVPWGDHIAEALSMVVFGWSLFETVLKKRNGYPGSLHNDGKIGIAKLAPRGQDTLVRWVFDDKGEATAMIQQPAPEYIERTIPLKKAVLYRTLVWKDNPEGRSLLRNAYRPWFFKKRIEEVEGIGIERDLNGIPFAKVPPAILRSDADDDEKATLEAIRQMIKNVRNDQQAGIIIPALYDENGNPLFEFDLLTTKGRRAFDTDKIIMRYNRTIALSMLADFVVIGHDNVGSFAMASSKTKVFSVAIGSYMDGIADQFNRMVIPKLMEVNGYSLDKLPKLTHGDIETIDLGELAQYINALSGAGLDLTGEQIRGHLAGQAGMPEDDIDVKPEPVDMGFQSGTSTVAPGGMKDKKAASIVRHLMKLSVPDLDVEEWDREYERLTGKQVDVEEDAA
jgi:hypothetical protein